MAGGAPLAPTDLGKRHGLQPVGELPQVTIEQVKKRLKDRYFCQTFNHDSNPIVTLTIVYHVEQISKFETKYHSP